MKQKVLINYSIKKIADWMIFNKWNNIINYSTKKCKIKAPINYSNKNIADWIFSNKSTKKYQ